MNKSKTFCSTGALLLISEMRSATSGLFYFGNKENELFKLKYKAEELKRVNISMVTFKGKENVLWHLFFYYH